jgi:prevent-host-death family protein
MNKTIPATKVRKNFFQIIQDASQPGVSVTITVGGDSKVVMMSVEEFEGWQETLEVMSDKKLMQDIKEGLAEIEKGETVSLEGVKKKFNL